MKITESFLVPILFFGIVGHVSSETVFNNLDGPTNGGSWGVGWVEDKAAQQFQLGTNNTVTSAELTLRRDGRLDGTLALELYADNSGIPGAFIGTLGTIDPMSIGSAYGVYLFNDPISNLTPEETYYLVLSRRDTIGRGNDSIDWRLTTLTGAPGAKESLATQGPAILDWHNIRNFPGGGPPFSVWAMAKVDANMSAQLGDFDQSGVLDANDIDMLTTVIDGLANPQFDLNNDSIVDLSDHHVWVKELKETWFGDANLDGEFDSGDLVGVFQAGEYEDNIALNSTWAEGDWNGDGDFDTGDLVHAFQDGGYEIGPRVAVSTVPEPTCPMLLVIGAIAICRLRKR